MEISILIFYVLFLVESRNAYSVYFSINNFVNGRIVPNKHYNYALSHPVTRYWANETTTPVLYRLVTGGSSWTEVKAVVIYYRPIT